MKDKQYLLEKGKKLLGANNITLAGLRRGVSINKDHALDKILSKCGECASKFVCEEYEREARCFFEIEVLKAKNQKKNAIVSSDPKDLLADMQMTLNKLEHTVNLHGEPDVKDLKNLMYLKMQLYKMKHCQPAVVQQNTQVNVNQNPMSVQVKDLMKELRSKENEEVSVVQSG